MRLNKPLPPGSTIGILGGGQLGRMLTLAAARLGIRCHIYAPEADSPAFQVAAAHTIAPYDDYEALAGFARSVELVTYEFENVPAETAAFLAARVPLAPDARALATAQDRVAEKTFLSGLGIAVAPFAAVDTVAELDAALSTIGRPAVLKTRRFGYDGKGQTRIDRQKAAATALAEIDLAPAILEGLVSFDHEVSVIAARGWDGVVACYDVPLNRHENHILATSTVPSGLDPALETKAREIAAAILTALDYVGVMGIELFAGRFGLMVNELAPRVHNSGHWTLDACLVSQFEQHIRAVCGWPLGNPARHSDVVMTNLLGDGVQDWQRLAQEADVGLHLYGKSEARRGRKMGHFNRLSPRSGD